MSSDGERRRWWIGLFVVTAATVVVCLPFLRFVAWLGDEGILLNAGQRMVRGQLLYRDFFEFMPPLAFMIVAAWMRVAGESLVACRVLAIGTITLSAAFTYAATVRVARAPRLAAVLVVLWAVGSQGNWTVLGHRWFTLLELAAATVLLLRALARPRAVLAVTLCGVLVGAAAVTTTPSAATFGIACFASLLLAGRPRAELAGLVGGALVVPALIVAWVLAHGIVDDTVHSVLGFLTHRYAGVQGVPYGRGNDAQSFVMVAAFPAALLLLIALVLVEGRAALRPPEVRAAILIAIAAFISCYPRPDVAHIGFAAPLCCPLIAHALARLGVALEDRLTGSLFARLLPFHVIGFAALLAKSAEGYGDRAIDSLVHAPLTLPRGSIRLGPSTNPEQLGPLLTHLQTLAPDDEIFFYPYDAMLPYLAGHRHAAAVYNFTPGYTWPSQYRQSCESAIRRGGWVLFDLPQMSAEEILMSWPKIGEVNPPEKVELERALIASFDLVKRTPRFELRRKRADATIDACRAIPSTD